MMMQHKIMARKSMELNYRLNMAKHDYNLYINGIHQDKIATHNRFSDLVKNRVRLKTDS